MHLLRKLALSTFVLLPLSARGGTHVWSGTTSQFWSTPSNWSSGGAPYAGETNVILIFPSAFGQTRTVIDNINGLVVDKITVAGGGLTFTGTSGAVLTFSNAAGDNFVDVSNPGVFNAIDVSLPVALSATTRFRLDNVLYINSKISGPGALTLEAGRLTLQGGAANTYVGVTTANAGNLTLGKVAGLNAFGGPLVLNGGTATVVSDNQIPDGATVSIYNSGKLLLKNAQETVGLLTMDNGNIASSETSLLTLGASIEASGASLIDCPVRIGGPSRTINVAQDGGIRIAGTISDPVFGAGGLVKNGEGGLSLAGENDFSGPVTVNAGTCYAWTDKSFGTPSGGVTVAAGAKLSFYSINDSAITIQNETLILAGTLWIDQDIFWTGPIVLSGDASSFDGNLSIFSNLPKTFAHTGIMSGSGTLRKRGLSRLSLIGTSANTYTGATQFENGEVQLSKSPGVAAICGAAFTNQGALVSWNSDEQIADGTPVILNSGTLDLGTNTETIASLSGAGGEVKFSNGKLICGNAIDTAFHGQMTGVSPLSFVKKGAGKMTLDGENTVTGAVQVDAGTLILNSSNAANINVFPGGTLTGSGDVGTIYVASGGKLNLGALTAKSLNANSPGAILVSALTSKGNGRLTTAGAVNIAGATLAPTLDFTPAPGQVFHLIAHNASGPVNGAFNGLPEGASLLIGGQPFAISYPASGVNLTYTGGAFMTEPKVSNFSITPVAKGSSPATVQIHIEADFNPDVVMTLQSSDDLVNWTSTNQSSVTNANGHLTIDFNQATAPRRFFRLLLP